jgi:hypothetical protein
MGGDLAVREAEPHHPLGPWAADQNGGTAVLQVGPLRTVRHGPGERGVLAGTQPMQASGPRHDNCLSLEYGAFRRLLPRLEAGRW